MGILTGELLEVSQHVERGRVEAVALSCLQQNERVRMRVSGQVPDKRALRILFRTYWSSQGWLSGRPKTPPADLAYAKQAGVMFDRVKLSHDEIVERAIKAVAAVTARRVAEAFVVSLSSRRLDLRSALGSFGLLRHLTKHKLSVGEGTCKYCGAGSRKESEDLNVLNFERFKWGGVRHEEPLYAMFDLEQFAKLEFGPPTAVDRCMLRSLIRSLKNAPEKTTGATAQQVIAKDLKSNKAERDTLVGSFGICGLLETRDHPGHFEHFVPANERDLPSHHFIDMAYPACWWRGSDGLAEDAVEFYFGQFL